MTEQGNHSFIVRYLMKMYKNIKKVKRHLKFDYFQEILSANFYSGVLCRG